ncbi:hypothetical protein IDM40_20625 [Nocardiopsis sp. HNM0947]|uniref:Uncharacterized protein n=1 Tax=Nocardiopsis coralli TaxID=2772213 RepID=A0ABR9PB49_9ACTN|nr:MULTISPECIES: hypothetical protein [Nocardiopsis]MBE3001078.1 hypothetical protein [Nocardiopsis coralli]
MSVVVLFGAGAFIGLVALTAVVLVTLLLERPSDPEHSPDQEGSVL